MSVLIELTPEEEKRLRAAAEPRGLSPQDLARAALEDFLARPSDDFEAAADLVLKKNAELYDRLA